VAGYERKGAQSGERDIPLRDIITHRFSLDKAEEAFALFNGATTGKVVFNWD